MGRLHSYSGRLAALFAFFAVVAGWYAAESWGRREATNSLYASIVWTALAVSLLVYRKIT
jgi:hypothetical protein